MHKRIDFSNLGGNPLDQQSFEWMQDAYGSAIEAIVRLIGDKAILTGVDVVGGTVTDGWITYNGKIVRFIGGAVGDEVVITETATYSPLFEDNAEHDVEFETTATCGEPGAFPFSDLKRAAVGVPSGTVLMWSGDVNNIPSGYLLCDGTSGTPNLSGMFIVGYDSADVDYNEIGKTGGAKSVALTSAQNGPHTHNVIARASGAGGAGAITDGSNDGQNTTVPTTSSGAGDPHENRPPYYTLAYIIKL